MRLNRLSLRVAIASLFVAASIFSIVGRADEKWDNATKPRSTTALAAIAKAEKIKADAHLVYRSAILKARRAELEELKTAQSVAMKKQDLVEANAIATLTKEITHQVDAISPEDPPSQSPLIGKWRVHSTAGQYDVELTSKEYLEYHGTPLTGTITYNGNHALIRIQGGWTEVWAMGEQTALIEFWDPQHASDFPSGFPGTCGFAERVSD